MTLLRPDTRRRDRPLRALMPPTGPVQRLATACARHPLLALLGWFAFVAATVVGGGMAGTRQLTDAQSGSGSSGRVDRVVERTDFGDRPTESVLVQSRTGPLDPRAAAAAVADLRSRLGALPQVAGIAPAVPSPDGRSRLVTVTLEVGSAYGSAAADRADDAVVPVLAATARVAAAHPDLRIDEVGGASLDASLGGTLERDFHRAELFSIPLTVLILLLAFGALLAAGVPVLLALSAVAAAIGLSALVSHLVPVTSALSSVVLLIGLAVGVDYSLFYLRREREERRRGATRLDAIEIAAATSGRAVLVSGCTVVIAMAGMFLSGNGTFVSFGVGTILVVAVAVLGSMTALPALLGLLGDWIDRPRVPFLHRLRRADGQGRLWPAVIRRVLRRPAVSFGVAAGALVLLALPVLGMRTALPGAADLPRSIPIVDGYERLTAAFPSTGEPHQVVLWSTAAGPLDRAAVTAAAAELGRRATSAGGFALRAPVRPEVSRDGRVARLDLPIPDDANSPAAARSLDRLRSELAPAALGGLPATEWGVTGDTASTVDFNRQLAQRLPWVFTFVLGLTFLVLLLTFRSVAVAATAIALNLLSVGAAYGVLVLVFQHTWAEGLLGFHSNGAVVSWLPLFLFVILFGLSMDYHVFVVSRIREAAAGGLANDDAVAAGITASAGVVTSAAAVMVGVFSIFATLTTLDFKQLGVGLAVAILLDATIVRAILLPSAMALLGRWNWWLPGWLGWLPAGALSRE